MSDLLDLADWRRQVSELYAAARSAATPIDGWELWRAGRARLFAQHPQSPIPGGERSSDRLPRYFSYDAAWRVIAEVEAAPAGDTSLPGSAEEQFTAVRFGVARAAVGGYDLRLALYWLSGYAGGLFASFRDATSGSQTYGAGRYLLDTAKGADLGRAGEGLVLDFNFAYQPSCSYDGKWSCPLPPRDNWLTIPVNAGERLS
ncbi:MAG: DUF1684 domain-containing protein [Chloroflexi bacterium]|nr:MAG: DUF1684 domain-containing protein [Chloroflexota bacterium]